MAIEALEKMGWQPRDPEEKAYYFREKRQWEELPPLGEVAVGLLIGALGDQEEEVRWGASRALGKTMSYRAVEPLVRALKDPNGAVRREAVEALGELEDPAGIDQFFVITVSGSITGHENRQDTDAPKSARLRRGHPR